MIGRAAVLARLRAGDRPHMQFAGGQRRWWFESPHAEIADRLMLELAESGEVAEAGDCLFGWPLNSQTWIREGVDGQGACEEQDAEGDPRELQAESGAPDAGGRGGGDGAGAGGGEGDGESPSLPLYGLLAVPLGPQAVKPGRVPCINPACNRTFLDEGTETVCGKCFKCLPAEVRNEFRRLWREHRKWERRALRTGDELEAARKRAVSERFGRLIERCWEQRIKPFFERPEKPSGLDSFLEEVGL